MVKVHSYESMGTYDGPGLRLVVFLQGCPFRCLYCANPDTIPFNGGTETEDSHIINMAVSQKPFFGSRGGVTFSGGEPTSQAADLISIVDGLHANGINVCIDTNGGVWNPDVEKLLGKVDLVLLDVKQINPERHESLTGRSNSRTLETAKWLEENGKPFWLRYVLVPGISDFEEDIRSLGEHFKDYKMIQRVEVLPYHTLGIHKYETMGQEYPLKDTGTNTPEQVARAKKLLDEYFNCVIVN